MLFVAIQRRLHGRLCRSKLSYCMKRCSNGSVTPDRFQTVDFGNEGKNCFRNCCFDNYFNPAAEFEAALQGTFQKQSLHRCHWIRCLQKQRMESELFSKIKELAITRSSLPSVETLCKVLDFLCSDRCRVKKEAFLRVLSESVEPFFRDNVTIEPRSELKLLVFVLIGSAVSGKAIPETLDKLTPRAWESMDSYTRIVCVVCLSQIQSNKARDIIRNFAEQNIGSLICRDGLSLSALAQSLALANVRSLAVWQALLTPALDSLRSFSPRSLCRLLWAMKNVRRQEQQMIKACAYHAANTLGAFSDTLVNFLIGVLGSVGLQDRLLHEKLLNHLALDSKFLAYPKCLYLLQRLAEENSFDWLFMQLLQRVSKELSLCSAKYLVFLMQMAAFLQIRFEFSSVGSVLSVTDKVPLQQEQAERLHILSSSSDKIIVHILSTPSILTLTELNTLLKYIQQRNLHINNDDVAKLVEAVNSTIGQGLSNELAVAVYLLWKIGAKLERQLSPLCTILSSCASELLPSSWFLLANMLLSSGFNHAHLLEMLTQSIPLLVSKFSGPRLVILCRCVERFSLECPQLMSRALSEVKCRPRMFDIQSRLYILWLAVCTGQCSTSTLVEMLQLFFSGAAASALSSEHIKMLHLLDLKACGHEGAYGKKSFLPPWFNHLVGQQCRASSSSKQTCSQQRQQKAIENGLDMLVRVCGDSQYVASSVITHSNLLLHAVIIQNQKTGKLIPVDITFHEGELFSKPVKSSKNCKQKLKKKQGAKPGMEDYAAVAQTTAGQPVALMFVDTENLKRSEPFELDNYHTLLGEVLSSHGWAVAWEHSTTSSEDEANKLSS